MRHVQGLNPPTRSAVEPQKRSHDLYLRSPFGVIRIKRDGTFPRPAWLVIGTYAVGAALVAAGVVLLFMRSGDTASSLLPLGAGLVLILANSILGTESKFDEYADQIRDRLDERTGQPIRVAVEPGGTANIFPERQVDPATIRASNTLERQEEILREIYVQGLAQTKLSFRVSLGFMSFGASVLLMGAALAVLKAPTTGDKYASVVASLAGVIITLTSSLFLIESNRARKSMGDQGTMLREESREDRRLSAARELAAAIAEDALRDQVRADLARQLLRMRIPDRGTNTSDTEPPARDGAGSAGDAT